MASANSTTPLSLSTDGTEYCSVFCPDQKRPDQCPSAGHSDRLVAFVQVALTAVDRALNSADCPDVKHLLECARLNLSGAHGLIQTDRRFAA